MDLNLQNKKALVCGGSQGLGLASAKELALLGASIILVSRSEDKLKKAVSELDVSKGQKHDYVAIDLSETEEAKAKIEGIINRGSVIHILVNNAGGPPSAPTLDTDAKEFEKSFRTHLVTAHVITQLLVPGMKKAGYGRIVNVVSTSVKQPINGLAISNSVRSAVASWAKTLSNEIAGFGITVNNVLPGYTNTDRLKYLFDKQANDRGTDKDAVLKNTIASIPAQRLGEPHEFGAAVAFLCSPAAAYINGINLPVDGGRTGCL